MKVAYLFSGHSRTWELCHENFFQNIYSQCPGDIFIHVWDRVNAATTSWWNDWNGLIVDGPLKELSYQVPNFSSIQNIYNPKIMIIEKDPSWNPIQHEWASPKYDNHFRRNHPETVSRFGAKYILYAFKKIFDAARNYSSYDRFFCSRIDINFLSKLNLEEFNNSDLVLSQTRLTSATVKQDIFFHGREDIVSLRSNFYYDIDQYWYDRDYINMVYEDALAKYLIDKQISVSESNIKFNIPRINGKITQPETWG